MRGGYLLYISWVTLVYSLFFRYLLFGSWCFGFVNMRELCSRYVRFFRVSGLYSMLRRYLLLDFLGD